MTTGIQKTRQASLILKYTFGILAVAAGADKFFNLLTQWSDYIAPSLADMTPISPSAFMMIVGVIEIIAGVIVFAKTRVGAYIVSLWLLLISLNLIISGNYLDVAVRDIVMAITAFALAKLSEADTSGSAEAVA